MIKLLNFKSNNDGKKLKNDNFENADERGGSKALGNALMDCGYWLTYYCCNALKSICPAGHQIAFVKGLR